MIIFLQKLILSQGGEIHEESKVLSIIPGDIVTVATESQTYKARSIILTPGPWAKELVEKVGLNLPIKVSPKLLEFIIDLYNRVTIDYEIANIILCTYYFQICLKFNKYFFVQIIIGMPYKGYIIPSLLRYKAFQMNKKLLPTYFYIKMISSPQKQCFPMNRE